MRGAARLLIFASFVGQVLHAAPVEPPTLLGSAGFQPSAQHPFGWRGDGSGCFPGAAPVTEWSPVQNVKWSAATGRSYSSPILADRFVVVTAEPNLVVCLQRKDGALAWSLTVTPAALADQKSRDAAERYELPKDGSGMAAATPVTDGKTIFTVFANGIVCAIGLDGKQKWAACIEEEQTTGYGRSASPLLVAGKLIVHMSSLYAFDPATGKRLWTNSDAKSSYGTPAAIRVAGVDLIVTPLGDVVQVSDGAPVNAGIGRTGHSSPVACGDGAVCFGDAALSVMQLDPSFKEKEIWSGELSGEVFGSPLISGGILFTITADGALFSFDARGKGVQKPIIDERALFERGDAVGPIAFGSLTQAGGYLFIASNSGDTAVIEASAAARLIRHNQLPAGTGSSPIFSGSDMFLRDGERLLCIGK